MFKKVWNFLGSLQLAFWLVLCLTATLTIGSLYSRGYYAFFELLDTMSVFAWYRNFGFSNLGISWWVALLYVLMGFLAVNTLVCATDRLCSLLPKRKEINAVRFLTLLSPSIIHILFVTIMLGHFLTFNATVHGRYPVEKGSTVTLPNDTTVKITDIETINYPDDSYLHDRLRNAAYSIEVISGERQSAYKFSFLNPLFLNGAFLHADVSREKYERKLEPGATVCNRAEVKHTETEKPQFYLLYTKDPGLPIIIGFLFVIMIVMIWYYYATTTLLKNNAAQGS